MSRGSRSASPRREVDQAAPWGTSRGPRRRRAVRSASTRGSAGRPPVHAAAASAMANARASGVGGDAGSGGASHAAASRAAGSRWRRRGYLTEDDAGDAGVAQAAKVVEAATPPATRISTSYPATSGAPGTGPARRRRATARAGDPRSDEPHELLEGRGPRAAPRERERRSGRGSSPTASQSPATSRQARRSSGRSTIAIAARRASRPAAKASRMRSESSMPPATWSGTADARRDRSDRLEIRRWRPARAPSKSTRWMTRAPWATNRSTMRSGRSVGAPTPAAAPGQ
jgi:hypothetical protein